MQATIQPYKIIMGFPTQVECSLDDPMVSSFAVKMGVGTISVNTLSQALSIQNFSRTCFETGRAHAKREIRNVIGV